MFGRGTVCDDGFSDTNAQVVCRQLGYSTQDATYFSGAYFDQGNLTIRMDDTYCTGNETMLQDCSYLNATYQNCYHDEDVSVRCVPLPPAPPLPHSRMSSPPPSPPAPHPPASPPSPPLPPTVRLVNGPHPWEGRIEVYIDGQW